MAQSHYTDHINIFYFYYTKLKTVQRYNTKEYSYIIPTNGVPNKSEFRKSLDKGADLIF